jgi:hypothetical protein
MSGAIVNLAANNPPSLQSDGAYVQQAQNGMRFPHQQSGSVTGTFQGMSGAYPFLGGRRRRKQRGGVLTAEDTTLVKQYLADKDYSFLPHAEGLLKAAAAMEMLDDDELETLLAEANKAMPPNPKPTEYGVVTYMSGKSRRKSRRKSRKTRKTRKSRSRHSRR